MDEFSTMDLGKYNEELASYQQSMNTTMDNFRIAQAALNGETDEFNDKIKTSLTSLAQPIVASGIDNSLSNIKTKLSEQASLKYNQAKEAIKKRFFDEAEKAKAQADDLVDKATARVTGQFPGNPTARSKITGNIVDRINAMEDANVPEIKPEPTETETTTDGADAQANVEEETAKAEEREESGILGEEDIVDDENVSRLASSRFVGSSKFADETEPLFQSLQDDAKERVMINSMEHPLFNQGATQPSQVGQNQAIIDHYTRAEASDEQNISTQSTQEGQEGIQDRVAQTSDGQTDGAASAIEQEGQQGSQEALKNAQQTAKVTGDAVETTEEAMTTASETVDGIAGAEAGVNPVADAAAVGLGLGMFFTGLFAKKQEDALPPPSVPLESFSIGKL